MRQCVNRMSSKNRMGNKGSIEIPEGNGTRFCDTALPEEIIRHIFSYVSVKDLVRSVTRVCKYWHYLLTEYHFWVLKLHIEGFTLPEASKERLLAEPNEAKVLRMLQGISGGFLHLNTNLLKNPSGEGGKHFWKITPRGNRLIVECPPVGSGPIPEESGLPTQHCFVSSYMDCTRKQMITLEQYGFAPWILDAAKPKILISEWVSARFDCDSVSRIFVKLVGSESEKTVSLSWSSTENDVINSQWYKVQTEIEDYPAGLKEIHYTNISKDSQFWAGNYGAKTAGSCVMFVL